MLTLSFKSLDPEVDPLVQWFIDLGFWDDLIECLVSVTPLLLLPSDLETRFKKQFHLPLADPTRTLFKILLEDMNGINLKVLGYSPGIDECGDIPKPWEDPETCTGKLYTLGLVRIQEDENLLKPINALAFDPRVLYLVGFQESPTQ